MLYGVIPGGGGGGGGVNKVSYWKAPSRGETPNRPPNPLKIPFLTENAIHYTSNYRGRIRNNHQYSNLPYTMAISNV